METLGSKEVSTKLSRIAELAKQSPKMVLTTLAHHIDYGFLREAYARTRKDAAAGVDQETSKEYEKNLEQNLKSLLERFKSGKYKAQPVKRVYIPKGDGKTLRPLGIPTLEDKILQRAVTMILEAVYEQDFYECSYGFRAGKSAHQALDMIWKTIMDYRTCTILDVDIKSFFDTIDHGNLREMLDQRVRDGVIRRTIDKWLKAGVMEKGQLTYPEEGTPQGGVISPLLANLYLHIVLDTWIEKTVRPLMKGRMKLIRYADDFILITDNQYDAMRLYKVLPKRFEKYGLKLHPEKTRIVRFNKPNREDEKQQPAEQRSYQPFDFLGFTHYWRRSRKGKWIVARKTAKTRLKRTLKRINEWCEKNRHMKIKEQAAKIRAKLQGHYNYFGITGNSKSLNTVFHYVKRIWKKWLSRRSQRSKLNWERFHQLLKKLSIPAPIVVHSIYARAKP